MPCNSTGGSQAYSAGGGSTALFSISTDKTDAMNTFVNGTEAQKIDLLNKMMALADSPDAPEIGSMDKFDMVSQLMANTGYQGAPELLDDDAFEAYAGEKLYRAVNSAGTLSALDIANDMLTAENTRISGEGKSVHGAGLYFADDYSGLIHYVHDNSNVQKSAVITTKVKSGAKIGNEDSLQDQYFKDSKINGSFAQALKQKEKNHEIGYRESIALYAMSKGYDGIHDTWSGYTVIYNRGAFVFRKNPQRAADL